MGGRSGDLSQPLPHVEARAVQPRLKRGDRDLEGLREPENGPDLDAIERRARGRLETVAGPQILARGLAVKMWVKGAPTATWVVSQLDEGRRFAWETTTRGVHTLADHVVEPSGTGTRLTLAVEYSGFMAKLFAPMIRKVCKDTDFKLKKIYELFPSGPAKGACKVAGLPKPTGCV